MAACTVYLVSVVFKGHNATQITGYTVKASRYISSTFVTPILDYRRNWLRCRFSAILTQKPVIAAKWLCLQPASLQPN